MEYKRGCPQEILRGTLAEGGRLLFDVPSSTPKKSRERPLTVEFVRKTPGVLALLFVKKGGSRAHPVLRGTIRMFRTLLVFLGLAGGAAHAAGFQAKTMRDPLSAREVERPLVLGKGWLELGLGTDVKVAEGAWGPEGEKVEWEDGTRFLYTTQRADLRFGITRRGELYGTFKTHYVNLTNETLGTDTSQFGIGDPRFGYKYELYRSTAPLTSVIAYAEYKGSAANESPGNYVGGPSTFSSFVMTTGTPDTEVGLRGKRQFGPLALNLGVGYLHRWSDVTQYAIETELNQFNMRVKPGAVTKFDAGLLLQAGPVALEYLALFQSREATRIGPSSSGFNPSAKLNVEEGSEGTAIDMAGKATVHVTRGFDLIVGMSAPVRGEDLMYFPIEDIHPTRGNTYSGTLEFRY